MQDGERERERWKELVQSSLRLPLPPDTDGVKARTGSWRELQLPGFHSNVDAGQVKREGEMEQETQKRQKDENTPRGSEREQRKCLEQ